MKKRKLFYLMALLPLFVACGNKNVSTTTNFPGSEMPYTSVSKPTITSSIPTTPTATATISPTVTPTQTPSQTPAVTEQISTISQIKEIGNDMVDGQEGVEVSFKANYVKLITDNTDRLMLFVDSKSYINVRVSSDQFNDYLKNRYLNCVYLVRGMVTKHNNQVEVVYKNLENVTSTPNKFDYSNITKTCSKIEEVYDDISNISLTNKKNGVGEIVTFNGVVISTDRSDSNSKAVFYDNNHVITVISEKKICDGKSDIGKEYTITGITSVKNGSPAVLLLDISLSDKSIEIDYKNAISISPSYFSKWYHLSSNMKDPDYADFAKLYLITGYVGYDTSRNKAWYLGLTDTKDGSLSDTGITTSIKGVYLMNYLNLSDSDVQNSVYADAFIEQKKISVYCSLSQFDSQNHAWKVYSIEETLKIVE